MLLYFIIHEFHQYLELFASANYMPKSLQIRLEGSWHARTKRIADMQEQKDSWHARTKRTADMQEQKGSWHARTKRTADMQEQKDSWHARTKGQLTCKREHSWEIKQKMRENMIYQKYPDQIHIIEKQW